MEEFNLLLLFICIILFSVFCLLLLKFSVTIPQILSCWLLKEMVHLIFYHPPIHSAPFYQLRCPDANAVFLEGCDTHSHSLSEIRSISCLESNVLFTFLTTERRLLWLLQDEKKDAFCTEIYFWKYTKILYLTRCTCQKYFNLHTCIKFSKFFTV